MSKGTKVVMAASLVTVLAGIFSGMKPVNCMLIIAQLAILSGMIRNDRKR